MSLTESIAGLAGKLFTDRRLFGKPAKYRRKNLTEIDIIVTPYRSDEQGYDFSAQFQLDARTRELLLRADSLAVDGKVFLPEPDDCIVLSGVTYKVMSAKNQKMFRYLDATERIMIIKVTRFGRNVSS